MTMEELRKEIDRIDSELIRLYGERMETVCRIGEYKREHHLPVTDARREQEVLDRAAKIAGEENAENIRALFRLLMAQSRERQEQKGAHEG